MFRYFCEEGVHVFSEKQLLPAVRNLATKLILSGKTESGRSCWNSHQQIIPPLPIIIISVCSRWASHLRSPFVWHAEERLVDSAEAGHRDKVEGVSNEISPLQICLLLSSFSVVVDKLSVFLMPEFLYLFSSSQVWAEWIQSEQSSRQKDRRHAL